MTDATPTPGPNDISFTQFLMPDGRPKHVWIERPNDIVKKAAEIRAAGFRFETEMLSDYQTISLTIAKDDGDYAIEVVPNGPSVPEAIDRMISAFDPARAALDEARKP